MNYIPFNTQNLMYVGLGVYNGKNLTLALRCRVTEVMMTKECPTYVGVEVVFKMKGTSRVRLTFKVLIYKE